MNNDILAVTISGAKHEELAYFLVADGAMGAVECSSNSTTLYFASRQFSESVRERIVEYRCVIEQTSLQSSNRDFVAESQVQWHPIFFSNLTIRPMFSDAEIRRINEVLIRPGSGFGTGHHSTTNMLLTYLAEKRLPRETLLWDIGAGSGILSLAFRALYGGEAVAWEVDELAIENAEENIRLNQAEGDIALIPRAFGDEVEGERHGTPQNIVANLYSSLHKEFEPLYLKYLLPNGLLMISGILATECIEMEEVFQRDHWKRLSVIRLDDWIALIYRKRAS